MPAPIDSALDPTLPPEITNEEDEARMSLIAAHPDASATAASTPLRVQPPPSPGVSALVTRFTPTKTAPPPEPSLAHAFAGCKLETVGYAATVGGVLIAAPDSFGLSFAFGAARIATAGIALSHCLEQNEASQISSAARENAVTTCHSDGGTPLDAADGSIVCAK